MDDSGKIREFVQAHPFGLLLTNGSEGPDVTHLPMLLQIPVFFALYSSLSSAVELRHAPFMFWISDLSQPDGLGITPLLMGASMYFQQKLTPQTAMMDSTQAKVMQMLPFIFTIFTFTFPSGLTLYWVTSNVLSIAQQQIINRIKTPEMQD